MCISDAAVLLTLVMRRSVCRFWWLICLSSRLSYSWSIRSVLWVVWEGVAALPAPSTPPLPPGEEIRRGSPSLYEPKQLHSNHAAPRSDLKARERLTSRGDTNRAARLACCGRVDTEAAWASMLGLQCFKTPATVIFY